MTLLETERLGRKISELLKQTGSLETAPKLAADYAAACHAANLRLQQCEAMIKAGDRPQAIQLAETAPNLLDLVTVLEFRGSDEWRDYCQQNSLSSADRIDERSVQALNQCYAQGITTDHPLYAEYRRAVLSRNDEEALKTLQSIARLNPADANAASELARLDAKVLTARLQHLGNSLEGAEATLLVAEIETIEAFGFKNKPDGEVWRKAQTVRCEALLADAARLKDASRWADALAKIDLILQLKDEYKIQLPAVAMQQLDTLQAWGRGEQEKDKKERQFNSLLGELHYRIQQSEEKDTSARYVKLPELRDDYEAIHKVWRSLTDFTRSIPEDATARFRKRSALLEAEIVRRTALHQRMLVASVAAVMVVGIVVGWLVTGQMKTRDFSKQLQAAVAHRQVHTADKLLEQAHSEKIGDTSSIAAAETFANQEHALQANFEATFSKLPQQLNGGPDASRLATLADQLTQVNATLTALAPDLKAENEPRVQAFEKQWQNYLSESSAAVNGFFDQWVTAAEKQASELDYRAPLDKTTSQLAMLASLMQKIANTESGFTNHLNLRSDLLERATTVQAKFAAYENELQKIDRGMTSIQKAHTLKEFSDGVEVIVSSEFSVSPAASAAAAVQSLNASSETVLRSLLGVTNASTWAFIVKTHPVPLVPEVVMPAERKMFHQLNSDPAVRAIHQRYRLWLDQEGKNVVEWITAGTLDATTGWKQIKAWTPSASATSATFSDHDYGYFGGQCKLSPTEPVYRLEQLESPTETTAFNLVGLESFMGTDDAYTKPLLEVLDSVKNSPAGSPLFRAYLFLRLMDMMSLQPEAWGLTFCPAARTHEAQIKSLIGEQPLNSGDWFIQSKVDACSQKLEQFFASVKSISYVKQAGGLLALAHAVSKDNFQYAGFIGLDGKPNFVDNAGQGEVFGYGAARKQPVWLAAKTETGKPLIEPAMPLSPLFVLESPRQEYLTKAGVNPSDALWQGALPLLFQKTLQP